MSTDEEKQAIRDFCKNASRLKQVQDEYKVRTQPLTKRKKELKQNILSMMDANMQVVHNGKAFFVTKNVTLSQGAIKTDHIEKIFDDVTTSDILKSTGKDDREKIINTLTEGIHNLRTKENPTLRFSTKRPRDFQTAISNSTSAESLIREYIDVDDQYKSLKKEEKEARSTYAKAKNECEEKVKNFMVREDIRSQKVSIQMSGGGDTSVSVPRTYYIRKKVSNTKKKINKTILSDIIRTAMDQFYQGNTTISEFMATKSNVCNHLVKEIEDLPKDKTHRVTLDKGGFNIAT